MTHNPSHEAHRARLPYVAAAAAAILGALYFVPSASAAAQHTSAGTAVRQAVTITSSAARNQLAETGSIDTTPYVIGGTVFLGMGAALLINATRRSRAEALAEADEEATEAATQG